MNYQKRLLTKMYKEARDLNDFLVLKSIRKIGPFNSILDVGCADGTLTAQYAKAAHANFVYGIEIVPKMQREAKEKGVECFTLQADREPWPFKDESIECIVSNQVIEHLTDVDHFLHEASRVLVKNGFLITSTNNLSSWHNIAALIFGWTPFDLTSRSTIQLGLGNPFALHKIRIKEDPTWTHKTIYTAKWLFEWQRVYNLRKMSYFGAGLYPLPAKIGNIFKRHAAFMILTTQKI